MKQIESYTAHKQDGILLNANEVSDNINEALKKDIKALIDTIDFNRYPDNDCLELRKAYGKYIQFNEEQILCGNGSDQMLDLIMSYYLSSGKTLYTLSPDFGMYDYYASRYDARILKFPCEKDGSFDVDQFIEMGKKNHVDFIIFSNPNNPTGHYLKNEEMLRIVEAFKDIPFVDDEAYIEFAQESMLPYINQYEHFYITRTLSKVFGLASIRTGFLIGNQKNIETLSKIKVPYSLNTLSQKIAVHALNYIEDALKRVKPICCDRDELLKQKFKGIELIPSHANFILVYSSNISLLKQLFEDSHIVIRTYPDKDYVRITIGNKEENQKVFEVLKQFEKEIL